MQHHGQFRGFEILRKGKSGALGLIAEDQRLPELFIRGKATYSANLNSANPVGTIQSIEHTLRSFDKFAAEQQSRLTRAEKELVDYQAQADRPFEHEQRLKQLLARQSELNSLLDLDKGDQQATGESPDLDAEPEKTHKRSNLAKEAEEQMRASGTAIREMPIRQGSLLQEGPITGKTVAKDESQIAVATTANRFVVIDTASVGRDVKIGERVSLVIANGKPIINNDRGITR